VVVLVAPFRSYAIERNLEVFLFACGVLALSLSGFLALPGEVTGWRPEIVEEALTAPLPIGDLFGVPVGIVQIVLLVGLVIYLWHRPILLYPGAMDPSPPGGVGGIDDVEQDHPADAGDLPDALQGPGGTGREIGGEEDRVKERLGFHNTPMR
jgi:hypothetical protein